MTRIITLFTTLLLSIGALFAQSETALTLHISKAGSLRSQLSDEQYRKTTQITLTGEINSHDLKTLQEMNGEQGALQSINLSQAHIVADQASNTFASLPMPTLAFGATQDAVKAYEAEHKGTYNQELSNPEEGLHALLWFDIAAEDILARCYFVSKNGTGELDEFWGFYPQTELAVNIKEEGYTLTESFVQLLAKNGFSTPQSLGEDGFVTTSEEKNLDLTINLSSLSEITGETGDKKVLVLMYAPKGSYLENRSDWAYRPTTLKLFCRCHSPREGSHHL